MSHTSGIGTLPAYRFERAVLPSTGESTFVIYESGGGVHGISTSWLRYLEGIGRSPNTVRAYGRRIAWYLSWSVASGYDWRHPSLAVLVHWKNTLTASPYAAGQDARLRAPDTVDAWMTATSEFYKWAGANGHVDRSVADLLFEERYVPAGLHGEQGKTVRVKASALTVKGKPTEKPYEWLELPEQRQAILNVELPPRDRFAVDLLYATGLRQGEALSMFREDLHFLPVNTALGCSVRGPHLHVKSNPSQNNSRAKGSAALGVLRRWVPVPPDVVASYEQYRSDRTDILGVDENPHVFVNLYRGEVGAAWTADSLGDLFERLERKLGFYVRPHMLRHTRATLWARGIEGPKLDPDVIQVLLGHATAQSTAIYTHTRREDLVEAVRGVTLRNDPGE